MKNLIKIFAIVSVLSFSSAFSQNIGLPKIINYYDPDNPYSVDQVWDIKMLPNGNIYFAASSYFIEFDAFKFNPILNNVSNTFYSFDIDTINKTLFIGSVPELTFCSLSNKSFFIQPIILPITIQSAWRTFFCDSVIYFSINKTDVLVKYNNEYKLIQKPHNVDIYRIFKDNNKVFLVSKEYLFFSEKDNAVEIPLKNNNILKEDIRHISFYDKNLLFIITKKGSFNILNLSTGNVSNFEVDFKSQIENKDVYFCTKINDTSYIITTLIDGVFIFNKRGKLLEHINHKTGLLSNSVYYAYVDEYKNIWLGTGKGITLINYNSPIRYIDTRLNLNSAISTIALFNKKIIVGTYSGIFLASEKNKSLEKISDIIYSNNIQKTNSNYYILTSYNKVEIVDTNFKSLLFIKTQQSPRSIAKSPKFKNRFYFIDDNAFLSVYEFFEKPKPELKKVFCFEELNLNPDKLYFDQKGNLWVCSNNLLILIDFNSNEDFKTSKIYYYNTNNGLPNERISSIFELNDTIFVSYETGTFFLENYDSSKKQFYFKKYQFFDNQQIIANIKVDDKSYFVTKEGYLLRYRNRVLDKFYFKANFENFFSNLLVINKQLIFNAKDRIFIIDTNDLDKLMNNKFLIKLSDFQIDSLEYKFIFNDSFFEQKGDFIKIKKKIKRNSNLTLLFNTNFYENTTSIRYYFQIKEDSDQWEYFVANKLFLRKVKPGTYKILVKATNYLNQNSNIVEIEIFVEKNWYERTFFVFIFILLALIIVYLLVQRTIKSLKQQKEQLEDVVQERTLKLEEQKEELELQTEELKEQKKLLERETKRLNTVLQELKILSMVAQKTNNSVVIVDKRGKFDWWNRYFIEMFEKKLEEYKDLPLREAHKKVRPDIYREIKNYTIDKGILQYTTYDRFNNGNDFWYQTVIIPVDTEDGLWFVVIDSNITEIKNLEKLIQSNQGLIDTYKNQLTKTIAELNLRNNEFKKIIKTNFQNQKYGILLRSLSINIKPLVNFIENFFIIDLPMSSISGDFNSSILLNPNELLFFIGDATGHNVKGAILGNITTNLINQIVLQNNNYSNAEILNELNKKLYDVLLKTKDDFVNIALMRFNKLTQTISFASSKIGLMLVEKNNIAYNYRFYQAQKINVSEDLMSQFNEIEIKITNKTRLYISTDGWASQFDKMGHKKYGQKQIEEFLLSIQNVDFVRHRDLILNELQLWRGNFEQIDDILIFGVQIDW